MVLFQSLSINGCCCVLVVGTTLVRIHRKSASMSMIHFIYTPLSVRSSTLMLSFSGQWQSGQRVARTPSLSHQNRRRNGRAFNQFIYSEWERVHLFWFNANHQDEMYSVRANGRKYRWSNNSGNTPFLIQNHTPSRYHHFTLPPHHAASLLHGHLLLIEPEPTQRVIQIQDHILRRFL